MAAVEEGQLSPGPRDRLSPGIDHGPEKRNGIEMSLLRPTSPTGSLRPTSRSRSERTLDNISRATASMQSHYNSRHSIGTNFPHYNAQYVDKVVNAVKNNDVEKLSKISKKLGTEGMFLILKEHDGKNNTALHYAALNDNADMMRYLINNGADVNDSGEGGKRPLHFAVIDKKKGKDMPDEHDGKTRDNAVSVLIAEGADVNATDVNGMTPLHFAARYSNMDSFITLLSAPEIVIDAQDRRKTTALCQACQSGNTDGALMLINKGADPLISDVNGDTPMHIAVRHSHSMIVITLLEIGETKHQISKLLMAVNSNGLIPFYEIVKYGNTALFKECLDHVSEYDDNTSDSSGIHVEDLLNFAGENGDTLLHVAASAGHVDIAETLIVRGARLDADNNDMQTPLHLACAANQETIARCLVEHGADPNIEDNEGMNPLQIAANHDSYETMMALLQCIATSAGGHCHEASDLLEWAAMNNKARTMKKILDYEFRVHDLTDEGIMNFIMHAVRENHRQTVNVLIRWKRGVVDHRDTNSFTPLHYAAKSGRDDIARELIKSKARVNSRAGSDEYERTPLHYAARNGWTRTARILLDSGANIDQRDTEEMTPLHLACRHGKLAMVELLLHGKGAAPNTTLADIGLQDVNKLNCLDHAIDNGHEDVAKSIVGHHSWQDVMASSSIEEETEYHTTPMRKLIRYMPNVAERCLDRCVTVKGDKKDKDMSVEFYYEFLEDSFSSWMKPDEDSEDHNKNSNANGHAGGFLSRFKRRISVYTHQEDYEDQFDDKGRLQKKARPFVTSTKERTEHHPLQIMASSQCTTLLEHPLVGAFLQHKWNTVGRYVFALSLFIYCVFLGMLTGYITIIPPNYYVYYVNKTVPGQSRVVWYTDGQQRWVEGISRDTHRFFDWLGPPLIVLLSSINLLREIGQIFLQGFSYFLGADNYLEWFLYITSILFALPFSEAEYIPGGSLKKEWQWRFGALAGFFGWINLLLFIRRNSRLGIYVIMFIDIMRTFLKFALILFLFIVAFAIAFYALLMNQNPFHTLGDCLSKTFVMMLGELDYADIFFGQDYLGTSNTLEADGEAAFFLNTIFYKGTTFAFFAVFLVVMGILMMNMLVGLAVDDIQAIQEKANLHRLSMQVEAVLEVQAKFPMWVWRSSVISKQKFKVHEVKVKKWMQHLTSVRKLIKLAIRNESTHAELHSREGSEQDGAFDKMRQRVKDMSAVIERATVEMTEGARNRDERIEQISASQRGLRERADTLRSVQERLEDRLGLMNGKLDRILKRLKVKESKVSES